MITLPAAFFRALASLAHPRMVLLMIWPVAVSLLFWGVLALVFGAQLFGVAESWVTGLSLYHRFAPSETSILVAGLVGLLGLLIFAQLVLITASLIIGIVSMPVMLRHVAARDYPELERAYGGDVAGSVWNALIALGILTLILVVTLPLWLFPMVWPFILPLALGWFNQRLFRYDALAEHATAGEMKAIFRDDWGRLWMLGVALAVIGQVPVVGFFMPVLGGLAFIHYGLARLSAMRTGSPVLPPPSRTGIS